MEPLIIKFLKYFGLYDNYASVSYRLFYFFVNALWTLLPSSSKINSNCGCTYNWFSFKTLYVLNVMYIIVTSTLKHIMIQWPWSDGDICIYKYIIYIDI